MRKTPSNSTHRKVPLQTLSKSGKTIFAYLRRSTKKEEQETSLAKQNDSISFILKDMGLDESDITETFSDTFTGYKIKTINGTPQVKRPGFKKMIDRIRACKTPCVVLAFNPSRLTRNSPDGTTIKELLGNYGNKQKIEYIRFKNGSIWDKTTSLTTIDNEVNKAVAYSERLAEDKQENNTTSLSCRIMPKTIKTPKGLKATERGMIETLDMPHIRMAFEMKAKGKTGKEICKYLSQNHINIKEGNLAVSIFSKTQYIGIYTHQKTGEVFDDLIFVSKKLPIEKSLWQKVQNRLGKKGGGYGEKQQGDIISPLLRWKEDIEKEYAFSVDIKTFETRTHKYYKNNAFGGISVPETMIFNSFLTEAVPEIIKMLHYLYKVGIRDVVWSQKISFEEYENIYFLERRYRRVLATNSSASKEELLRTYNKDYKYILQENELITDSNISRISQRIIEREFYTFIGGNFKNPVTVNGSNIGEDMRIKAISLFQEALKNTPIYKESNQGKAFKKSEREELERKIEELKKRIDNATILLTQENIKQDIYDRLLEKTEKEINEIAEELNSFEEATDIEQFIERLPEVLTKTFELASRVLQKTKKSDISDDLYKLLEIVTFELQISTKKELTVKLFDVLTDLKNMNGGRYRIRVLSAALGSPRSRSDVSHFSRNRSDSNPISRTMKK